jgi:SAM-dependent MidA family methyltransferase
MSLEEIIIEKIRTQGPLAFHDFMEMCLYEPDLGYYTSGRQKIGTTGDFYTSACLTPVFGAMIGKKIEEMWQALGCQPFTLVEYGAGPGNLCHDILVYLQQNNELYNGLRYCIIEKSPQMRAIEKTHLFGKVEWLDAIQEIGDFNGCVLSNELLDNLAVHQVLMEEELMEVFLTYDEGFKELLKPATPTLKAYLQNLNVALPKGFRTEINLQALEWLKEVTASLTKGFVFTIDYGDVSAGLYKPYKSQGTLLCYRNHTLTDRLYEHVGEQDITSHVNFSALMLEGEKLGLKTCSYTDQCNFLLGLGFKQALETSFLTEKNVLQAARQISMISHTLLYDMGLKFKVLIQEKCA